MKRKIGLERTAGNADGLTRTQAERQLRRLVDATTVATKGRRNDESPARGAGLSAVDGGAVTIVAGG